MQLCEVMAISIFILQMSKVRHRKLEGTQLARLELGLVRGPKPGLRAIVLH